MKSLAFINFEVVKKKIPSSLPLTARDYTLRRCNRVEHAMDFLKAIPIAGLNQTVGPRKFSSVLQYHLGIPFFEEKSLCSCWKRPMDVCDDHAIHCASEVGQKFCHDLVKDVFADICYKGGVAARKEVSLGF